MQDSNFPCSFAPLSVKTIKGEFNRINQHESEIHCRILNGAVSLKERVTLQLLEV